jgi:general secretion pathway protein G
VTKTVMSRIVNPRHKGFTLIEMLIVIVVIAILALIVIPRLLGAGRKAKEATLRGDLHQIRNAIQQFEADCGDYPSSLDQLMTQPAAGDGGTGIALDVNGWQGPYLRTPDGNMPKDPFTDSSTTWSYTASSGDVHSGSTLTAINGEAYNTW